MQRVASPRAGTLQSWPGFLQPREPSRAHHSSGGPGTLESQHRYLPAETAPTETKGPQAARVETLRFKALDTLRGLAALTVTFYHLSFAVKPVCRWPLHLCVDFFLVLSGFVLAHTYTFSWKSISPLQFIGHRYARLGPLQAYTAIVTFLIRWLAVDVLYYSYFMEVCYVMSEVFLLNGLGLPIPVDANNPPSWTVSCEFWINVPFAWLVTKDTPPAILLVAAVIGQGLLYIQAGSLATTGGYFGLLRCSSSFLLGTVGYMAHKRRALKACEGLSTLVITIVESVLSILVFCIFADSSEVASTHDFIAPPVFIAVVMCFAREQGLISQAFSRLEILGSLSYSIYLNHRGLLALLWPNGPNPWIAGTKWTQPRALALLWALLLPYSYLTYRIVELPCLRFLRGKVDARARESLGFEGQWLHRGEIVGNEFIALNGTVGSIVKTGPKQLVMAYDGEVHNGELWDDGHLHWADGDIWIRCRADSIVVVSL